MLELNEENFEPTLATANQPCVVDFYAPWCGPCKMIAPLLEQLAEHFAGRIRFRTVNVDDAPELAAQFAITGVPTLLLFYQGEVRDRIVGFVSPRVLGEKLEALAALNGPAARAEAHA